MRLAVVVALVLSAAAGCGGDARPVVGDAGRDRASVVDADPYELTCGDLARQPESSENQRLVIRAEFALAQEPVLRERVEAMTLNRAGRSVYWALTEICKGRDASYKPARDAVEAVRRGSYLVQPRPERWSHPELYWNP